MCQAQKSIAPNVCVESTIISLSEWCEPLFRGRPVSDTLQLLIRYHVYAVNIQGIAYANSTLINGVGRYVGGPKVDLAVISVEKRKRYRLRLISMSCEPNFCLLY